jgi:hypothetical protein
MQHEGHAVISSCGLYRYSLMRKMNPHNFRTMCFIMLNPSVADATIDDPTIRRCISFAQREGCGHLQVVNCYALRSTDPKKVYEHEEPIGPENLKYIENAIETCDILVAAWGANPVPMRVLDFIKDAKNKHSKTLWVLGQRTKHGSPRHPLYVASNTPLEEWNYE